MDAERLLVVIETSRHRISGEVTVPAGSRLSDYVNEPGRDFFAVTEVHVAPLDEPDRARTLEFMLVARHEVATVQPVEVHGAGGPARPEAADQYAAFLNY